MSFVTLPMAHFVRVMATQVLVTVLLVTWLMVLIRENDLGRFILIVLAAVVAATAVHVVPPVRAIVLGAISSFPRLFALLVAAAAIVLVLVFRTDSYWTVTLTLCALYVVVGVGLNLQTGTAGLVNLAGAAFFGAGAYTTTLLTMFAGWPSWLSLLMGGAVAFLLGGILAWPVTNLRGHYLALVTIAFGVVFHLLLVNTDAVGGPQGIQRIPSLAIGPLDFGTSWQLFGITIGSRTNYALAALLLAAFALWVVTRIRQSPLGIAMNTVRDDPYFAAMAGIDDRIAKFIAFSVGCVLLGLGGGLYAHMLGSIAPEDFTFAVSLFFIAFVILGGLDSPFGVTTAAIILTIFTEKLRIIEDYRFLIFGTLVILVLIFRPSGLIRPPARRFPVPARAGE